jgi:hypothetical protein
MSDEALHAMTPLRASMERAIRRQLGRLTREGSKSPSDVPALLQADRDRIASESRASGMRFERVTEPTEQP